MNPSNELTNAPKASHLPSLKKKRIIPNAVLPSPEDQHVRSSALFRPSIISPKNATDSPMCWSNTRLSSFAKASEAYGGCSSHGHRSSRSVGKSRATISAQMYAPGMPSRPSLQHAKRSKSTRITANMMMSTKTYSASPSMPSSYRAKRQISPPIDLEKSMRANIDEYKAKLSKCNSRIQSQQHLVKVPVIRALRNMVRKLYEADQSHLRIALLRWKSYTDELRQQELRVKQLARTIKSLASGKCIYFNCNCIRNLYRDDISVHVYPF
jgi:hypothetical protein